jgi:hypothetical protein
MEMMFKKFQEDSGSEKWVYRVSIGRCPFNVRFPNFLTNQASMGRHRRQEVEGKGRGETCGSTVCSEEMIRFGFVKKFIPKQFDI